VTDAATELLTANDLLQQQRREVNLCSAGRWRIIYRFLLDTWTTSLAPLLRPQGFKLSLKL